RHMSQPPLTQSASASLVAGEHRFGASWPYFGLEVQMLGFEIISNGAKHCTAGIGEPGDVRVSVVWVLRRSQDDLSGTPGTADETISLTIGGRPYSKAEYVQWPSLNLKRGDELTIRVVESDSFDSPTSRSA